MDNFTIHASDLSPNRITVNIETSLDLTIDDVRRNLRRIGGVQVIDLQRDGTQFQVTIVHREVNPHPLNVRIWKVLESAYHAHS